ncbi:MAG TPA: AbrB family transcriptional regulator [Chloroflexota bacterium]|jgi:antitoxin PrlF|nr:AbrB family transcriptional regulator [Chloroflexota bacterium]
MFAISRITTRGRTTVPRIARLALGIRPGDAVIWEVLEHDAVRARRLLPADHFLAGVESTLSEWDSPEDDEAYREL